MENDERWARALAMLTPEAVAAFRGDPILRRAVERLAIDASTFIAGQDEFGLWVSQHDRRFVVAFTLAVLEARDMGLTTGELLRTCQRMHGLKRGVVADFLDRGVKSGDLVIGSAAVAWGSRKLSLQPQFHQRLRDGISGLLGNLGELIPEFAGVAEALEDPATLRRFVLTFGMISTFHPELVVSGEGPIALFTDRDRGLGFLLYFLEHQTVGADRVQLLERVTVSRRRLAREMLVSRMHVARLLEDGVVAGALSLPSPDQIVFSQALSEHFESRMAVGLQILRAVCVAARLHAPVDHGRLARVDRRGAQPAG